MVKLRLTHYGVYIVRLQTHHHGQVKTDSLGSIHSQVKKTLHHGQVWLCILPNESVLTWPWWSVFVTWPCILPNGLVTTPACILWHITCTNGLRLQFPVLPMMGVNGTRNMYSKFAVKYRIYTAHCCVSLDTYIYYIIKFTFKGLKKRR
jgi:hypothetical protein